VYFSYFNIIVCVFLGKSKGNIKRHGAYRFSEAKVLTKETQIVHAGNPLFTIQPMRNEHTDRDH